MQDPTRLVTAAELASHWGVSRAHIYNLLHLGLPSVKVGQCRRFNIPDATAWVNERQEVA